MRVAILRGNRDARAAGCPGVARAATRCASSTAEARSTGSTGPRVRASTSPWRAATSRFDASNDTLTRRGDARRGHPAAARLGDGRGREPPRRRVDRGLRASAARLLPGEGEPEARGGAGTRAVEPGPCRPVPRVDRRVVRFGGPVARAVSVAGAAADLLLRRGRPRRRQGRRGHSPARMRDHRRTGRGRGTSACTQVACDQRAPGAAAARAIPGRIGRALRSGALTTRRPDVQGTTGSHRPA